MGAFGLPHEDRPRNKLFRDLRSTGGRNLEQAGISRSVAMKLTGHKTEHVYQRDSIVSESDLIERLPKLSRSGPDGLRSHLEHNRPEKVKTRTRVD